MSEQTATKQALIFDVGSGTMKIGLSGELKPKLIFPSYVGKVKHQKILFSIQEPEFFTGIEANERRGLLKLSYPIEHGQVNDWSQVECLLNYSFTSLQKQPEDSSVLLTEAALNPLRNRERAAELMFEKFKVPQIFFGTQTVLSMYASGQTTGLCLDVGDGVTQCVPIYDGYAVTHAISRSNIGGRDITFYLANLLRRAGYIFTSSSELEIVRSIKESICYISMQIANEEKLISEGASKCHIIYQMPDGTSIQVGPERFRAPELLFSTEKVYSEQPNVLECLKDSILKTDYELRKIMTQCVLITGGSSLIKSFNERLQNEWKKNAPKEIKIQTVAPPDRDILCWRGGSLLASLQSFNEMWISKSEFEEQGKRILQYKTC